jgi:inorganic pyrophosphatase
MDEKELKTFLLAQIDEINRYKWIEREKKCRDIGFQQAALEWISEFSADFKDKWEVKTKGIIRIN